MAIDIAVLFGHYTYHIVCYAASARVSAVAHHISPERGAITEAISSLVVQKKHGMYQ